MFDVDLIFAISRFAVPVLLVMTAAIMWSKSQVKNFPWFFRYLILVAAKAPILYLVQKYDSNAAYFYAYYAGELLTIGLSLLVIYEIYRHVLTSGSITISGSSYLAMYVGLFLIAVLVAWLTVTTEQNTLMRTVLFMGQVARVVQIGSLGILVILSCFFGFYWRSQAFGIMLGYGLFAAIDLAGTTFRLAKGNAGYVPYALTKILAYQGAVLIWCAFAYRDKRAPVLTELPQPDMAGWLGPLERLSK